MKKSKLIKNYISQEIVPHHNLLPRQLAFCHFIVEGNGLRDAAILAGYSQTSAHTTAHKLINNQDVSNYIDTLFLEKTNALKITKDIIVNKLFTISELALSDKRYSEAVKALQLLSNLKSFIEKEKILQVNSDTVTKEEAQSLMKTMVNATFIDCDNEIKTQEKS